MAELFESSEEENNDEFVGFTIDEILERFDFESDFEISGESDIFLGDELSENGSENSDFEEEEVEEDSIWIRDFDEIDIVLFEENVGSIEILFEEVNCFDFLYILFFEEFINLIVVEINRNVE